MATPIVTLFKDASDRSILRRVANRVNQGMEDKKYLGDHWLSENRSYDECQTSAPEAAMAFLMSTPEQIADDYKDLAHNIVDGGTAYTEFMRTDTYTELCAILGRPKDVRIAPLDGSEIRPCGDDLGGGKRTTRASLTAGRYLVREDVIELRDTRVNGMAARGTVTHEMAHVWQARQGDFIEAIWSEYEIRPPKSNTYASSSKLEHQADAISAALICLDIIARSDIDGYDKREVLRSMERYVPGVRVFTRIFLSHPLINARLGGDALRANITPLLPSRPWAEPIEVDATIRTTLLGACAKSGVQSAILARVGRGAREVAVGQKAINGKDAVSLPSLMY